jgi:hypothetical protein
MEGIKQIISRKAGFLPRTQAQARAALVEGLVDEAVFIWKAVNIHPVLEEPWDFNEIDRLLAKEDLDLETTIVLMTIFERLIRGADKETALFAAESINAIEKGFARRAKALRERAAAEPGSGHLERLASLFRDYGMACFARPVLKRFYLGEALGVIAEIRTSKAGAADAGAPGPRRPDMAALEIGILLELGEAGRADARIAEELAAEPDNEGILLLAARSRFERREWRLVLPSLQCASEVGCGEDFAELRDFWAGGSGDV